MEMKLSFFQESPQCDTLSLSSCPTTSERCSHIQLQQVISTKYPAKADLNIAHTSASRALQLAF